MIKCYAITEALNFNVLSAYLVKYPLTKLVGRYDGGTLRYSEILDLSVQMVFIDYSLLQKFRNLVDKLLPHTSIIYLSNDTVSAHQAFEDGALDYISCPFDFARFEKCVNKFVRFSLLLSHEKQQEKRSLNLDSFFVKPDRKAKIELLINCEEVLFIEAYQNDVNIHMVDGRKFVCYYTMKEMEENLSSCFLRVHKSFMINYKKMSAFDGSNIIMQSSQQFKIPLGGVYKKIFFEKRNTMLIRKTEKIFAYPFMEKALKILITWIIVECSVFGEILYI